MPNLSWPAPPTISRHSQSFSFSVHAAATSHTMQCHTTHHNHDESPNTQPYPHSPTHTKKPPISPPPLFPKSSSLSGLPFIFVFGDYAAFGVPYWGWHLPSPCELPPFVCLWNITLATTQAAAANIPQQSGPWCHHAMGVLCHLKLLYIGLPSSMNFGLPLTLVCLWLGCDDVMLVGGSPSFIKKKMYLCIIRLHPLAH